MPFQKLLLQLGKLFKNLSTGKLIAIISLFAFTISGFVILMMWNGMHDFQLLYSKLTPEEAGEILAQLKADKIPYQVASNGGSILVPTQKVYETRMELASKGMPHGGCVGFEIFDNTKLGMTEFAQNVNYQRALQGELARTINQFDEVESSRVHIVMGSKSLFIDKQEPATASIVVKLRAGKWLSKGQVDGIVHLFSTSVPGLKPGNVTVVDNNGKMLAGFNEKSAITKASSDQLEYRENVERNLENRIKTMLDGALGNSKAVVRVSCSLDFKKLEKTEELYYPDNKVVRSEQVLSTFADEPDAVPMGVPGVLPNKALVNAKAGKIKLGNKTANKNQKFQKQDKTVNYEIGKVISHTVEPVGKINRISVAVILDGIYKYVEVKKGEQELKYFPRSDKEMSKFENIVKRAMNYNVERGDKVEVVNIPFETSKLKDSEDEMIKQGWFSNVKNYFPSTKNIFLGIFLFLAFVYIIRPLVKWLTSSSIDNMAMLNQLPKTIGEIEREYGGNMKSLPYRDKALQIISGDSNSSLQMMQEWMKGS